MTPQPNGIILKRSASPLDQVVQEAARKLLCLRMTNIFGEADEHDAKNLVSDLEAIWEIVDPMIASIGDYAAQNFNGIDRGLFVDQLQEALVGNATHTIESAGERIKEDRMELAS